MEKCVIPTKCQPSNYFPRRKIVRRSGFILESQQEIGNRGFTNIYILFPTVFSETELPNQCGLGV